MKRRVAVGAGLIYAVLTATGYWIARSNPSNPCDPKHDPFVDFCLRAIRDPSGAQRLWVPVHQDIDPIPVNDSSSVFQRECSVED